MLSCQRSKFSLPKRVTYLNCSYMSPMLKSVEKAGIRGLRLKRNPVEVTPNDFFLESELLRKEYARLINVSDANRIAIVPAVSYGMASVAANLKLGKGENIIVAAEQFPSNYYVWQRLCAERHAALKIISAPEQLQGRGKGWNERILEAIDKDTTAVAIAHTHWADGTRFDLEAIRKRTTEVGALLIIDGSQSIGAMPFDVNVIKPDAVVSVGYKWMLGPYSIGFGYYGEYFDNGKPIEENWVNRLKSEDFTSLVSYNPEYQPGALRYEVGEHSNFILVPMMLKALGQINKWKPSNIQEYCANISTGAIGQLRSKGFWIEDDAFRGRHIIGVRLPSSMDVEKVKAALLKNKIYVSFRGTAIRVSPNVYNTEADLNRLVKALTRL